MNTEADILMNILFDQMTPTQFKRFTKEYDELYNNGWQMTSTDYKAAIEKLTRECLQRSVEEKNVTA